MEERIRQIDELRLFFKERPNEWIPLNVIMRLGIAQYNARIYELRAEGMKIEQKSEMVEGRRHSYYRYVKYESAPHQTTLPFLGGSRGQ